MENKNQQRPFLASLWMIGALISISGMAVAGRELSSELNAFQISFTRSFLCFVSLLLLLIFIGFKHIKTKKIKLHVFRNIIHFGGQTGWLYGVALLPLAEVFAIEFQLDGLAVDVHVHLVVFKFPLAGDGCLAHAVAGGDENAIAGGGPFGLLEAVEVVRVVAAKIE